MPRLPLLLACALLALVPVAAPAAVAPGFERAWGSLGSGQGQFDSPFGIAVDPAGNVYVTDVNNARVEKFSSDGAYLAQWGSPGAGPGQFTALAGIAADPFGFVYVADDRRIQKFTSAGVYMAEWTMRGSSPLQPFMLGADPDGHLFATELVFGLVDEISTAGPYLSSWATGYPQTTGIAVDDDGFLYIGAGPPTCVIEKVLSGGAHIASIGGVGDGDGLLRGLLGIACGPHGPVVATDFVNDEVQAFASDGTFLYRFGSPGAGPGQLVQPIGVALDATGAIYVVDSGNQRIQKFSAAATPAAVSSWGRIKRLYR